MDAFGIEGNPGWLGEQSGDTDTTIEAFQHGGSRASITLICAPHSGGPTVELGTELTFDDCIAIAYRLLRIAGVDSHPVSLP